MRTFWFQMFTVLLVVTVWRTFFFVILTYINELQCPVPTIIKNIQNDIWCLNKYWYYFISEKCFYFSGLWYYLNIRSFIVKIKHSCLIIYRNVADLKMNSCLLPCSYNWLFYVSFVRDALHEKILCAETPAKDFKSTSWLKQDCSRSAEKLNNSLKSLPGLSASLRAEQFWQIILKLARGKRWQTRWKTINAKNI